MPIMPIDPTRNHARINPIDPLQRVQATGLRFKPAGAEQANYQKQLRKTTPGRFMTVSEERWIRRYGVLADGTRILLEEKPEREEGSAFALPRGEARVIPASPQAPKEHDPEDSMKASGERLKALLKTRSRMNTLRE